MQSSQRESNFEYVKVPPHDKDLEDIFIGELLIDKKVLTNAMATLKPVMFYFEKNAIIFDACYKLFQKGTPIDMITVADALKKDNKLDKIGGVYEISLLSRRVGSASNHETHASLIKELYIARQAIQISMDNTDRLFNSENPEDVISSSINTLTSLISEASVNKPSALTEIIDDNYHEIEQIESGLLELIGTPTGFIDLDKKLLGWQKSDLIIVAARPGMGKTSFALSSILNMAKSGSPVAFFSLEMSKAQLGYRAISMDTGITFREMRSRGKSITQKNEIFQSVQRLRELSIFIDDTAGINTVEIKSKATELKQKYDIQAIFVDYLQLISPVDKSSRRTRENEVTAISRELKLIAKELNLPVIALSQLSRSVENRGGQKRPQLSDLRESGAIEQDADIVIFIYRPSVYGIEMDDQGNRLSDGYSELMVEKHRNGGTGDVPVRFIDYIMRFVDIQKEREHWNYD